MSLLRTAARASVATRVIGNTHRRQQQRWAAQDAATPQSSPAPPTPQPVTPAPPAAAPAGSSVLDQLTQLGQLRDAGVLTETEFETQKQRILASA
ncbi:SHOCT domain-containing protein [Leucobacter soli]|uniref:SHOCT domain-containing protein n=1 Tax=Leucobacter soli TaxID=2812850 RepID=UPI003619335B